MHYYLNDLGIISAVGVGKHETLANLIAGDRSGLVLTEYYSPEKPVYVGQVNAELPTIPAEYSVYDCKNNRLLLGAVAQIRTTLEAMLNRYGADRIGIVLGTSTSGVANTELALQQVADTGVKPASFHYKQQQLGAGADLLAHYLGILGPAYTVSTACSSSGNALAAARRLLSLDLCDAVLVGGADSLCKFTVQGFQALESVSTGRCKPFGKNRDGINLAEAACLFIMSREPGPGPVKLAGIGATSDAYHFSTPDPEGVSVIKAMQLALNDAGLNASAIDYINLHGTATVLNDAMESKAVARVFGDAIAVSSTKGMSGHTLGAASSLELGFCYLLLCADDINGALLPNINEDHFDATLPQLNYVKPQQVLGRRINACQSNSFAFGGNNISLIVTRS